MSRTPESAQTWLCPTCRVLLHEGAHCDTDPSHEVVSLRDEQGRAALGRELWDAPGVPRRLTPESVLLIFVVMGLVLGVWAMLSETPGRIFAAIAERAAAAKAWLFILLLPPLWLLLWLLGKLFLRLLDLLIWTGGKLKRLVTIPDKKLPRGVYTIAPDPGLRKPLVGTIRTGESLTAPVSGQPCIAHLTCLCTDDSLGGPILISETATAGFAIDLDDGGTVYVPAGRLWLQCEGAERIHDRAALDAYVSALSEELTDRRVLPYEYVTEAILQAGDRVALRGKTSAVSGGYRESYGQQRRVVGVPHLCLLERSAGDSGPALAEESGSERAAVPTDP